MRFYQGFYQELTIIKSPEISPYFIWNKVYTQVHLAFVEQQNLDETVNFGVSFPEYFYQYQQDSRNDKDNNKEAASLGTKLRIFAASQKELEQLNLNQWLERLTDYVHIKSVRAVPENLTEHLLVKRYRPKTPLSLERETRRFMQRESARKNREISFDEAKSLQNQRFAEKREISLQAAKQHYLQPAAKNLPFVKLKSLSNTEDFSLQIEQVSVSQPLKGTFNTYGLSVQGATVPTW